MLKKVVADAEFVISSKPPKDCQAEAFLSAIFFCCYAGTADSRSKNIVWYDWDFTRVCWLMNTYGNVFELPFSNKCRMSVGSGSRLTRETGGFVNNLRLTPIEAKGQLFEICNELLNINPRKEEDQIRSILVKELIE